MRGGVCAWRVAGCTAVSDMQHSSQSGDSPPLCSFPFCVDSLALGDSCSCLHAGNNPKQQQRRSCRAVGLFLCPQRTSGRVARIHVVLRKLSAGEAGVLAVCLFSCYVRRHTPAAAIGPVLPRMKQVRLGLLLTARLSAAVAWGSFACEVCVRTDGWTDGWTDGRPAGQGTLTHFQRPSKDKTNKGAVFHDVPLVHFISQSSVLPLFPAPALL